MITFKEVMLENHYVELVVRNSAYDEYITHNRVSPATVPPDWYQYEFIYDRIDIGEMILVPVSKGINNDAADGTFLTQTEIDIPFPESIGRVAK